MAITVVTPPSAVALTTLLNAKDELGIDPGDASQDERLERLIARASSSIERYCSRRISLQTVDETMEWTERARLVLSVTPVASVASVAFDGGELASEEWEIEDAEIGMLFLRSHWGASLGLSSHEVFVPGITKDARGEQGRHLWTVRYTGGWWLPSMSGAPTAALLPADLEDIALEVVQGLYARSERDPRIQAERLGDWSATYGAIGSSGLPEGVEKRLMQYARLL